MPDRPTECIARGLCTAHGRVLLCQNLKHSYYYLPGGHIEFAEPAAAALAREFLEETGLAATIGSPLLITEQAFTQGKKARHEINIVFHVEHLGPPADEPDHDAPTAAPMATTTQAPPAPADPDGPPTVPSLEAGIAFEWMDLAAVPDLDIRPEEIKAWLAAGGQTDGPPVGWLSACHPADNR